MTPLRAVLEDNTTEAHMYAALRSAARIGGWALYHTWRSDHSEAGFPDILAIRGGELLVFECKTRTGKVRAAQVDWLEAFRVFADAHGLGHEWLEARVIRPADIPACIQRLASRPGMLQAEVM